MTAGSVYVADIKARKPPTLRSLPHAPPRCLHIRACHRSWSAICRPTDVHNGAGKQVGLNYYYFGKRPDSA